MTATNPIQTMIRSAYKDMDPVTGMFPEDWPCQGCGRKLNADGGHPAELYAGTFTGLCYRCERAGPYVVRVYDDGGYMLSYPPNCPSWRRDRETHHAYADCLDCEGAGHKMEHRSSIFGGGSYRSYCKTCMARFSSRPVNVWRERRWDQLRESAQDRYLRVLKVELGLPAHISTGPRGRRFQEAVATLSEERRKELGAPIVVAYERGYARLKAIATANGYEGTPVLNLPLRVTTSTAA